MTTAELRDLLAEVEKHGGPRLRRWFDKSSLWANNMTFEDGEAAAVGVVKRDLIERGYLFDVHYMSGANPWLVRITGKGPLYRESGHSELEAILKAWLAAAEAEGWTS